VQEDSRPKADLVKLGGEPILVEDDAWPAWAEQKRRSIAQHQAPLVAPGVCTGDLSDWAQAIGGMLAQQIARGPITAQGCFPWIGGVTPDNPIAFFQALTVSLQEDFALMVPDHSGELTAQVLSVCFPSGWDPREKLGRSLAQIHAPVADNKALQQATPAMTQAMVSKGPFIRYVWTLAGDNRRSRAPGQDTLSQVSSVDALWFRCERQITIPLAGQACLFLIRVFVARYLDVINTPARHQRIVAALSAMTPAMLAYKNISRAANLILESSHV
jgi:hypothetical protein